MEIKATDFLMNIYTGEPAVLVITPKWRYSFICTKNDIKVALDDRKKEYKLMKYVDTEEIVDAYYKRSGTKNTFQKMCANAIYKLALCTRKKMIR